MNVRVRLRLCRCRVLLLALAGVSLAAAAREPEFPAPDKAGVTVVADSVTAGGRVLSVREFTTEATVEQVVAFYHELWRDPPEPGAPGVAYEPTLLAPWQLLTRLEDGYVMTVQVKPRNASGSFGYLAIGRVPAPDDLPVPTPPLPALRDSTVLSQVSSEDVGKSAQTALLTNGKSLQSNVNFYRNQYAGWRTDVDRAMGHGKLHALGYRRGREQVIITIQAMARGGSQVVVNLVEHGQL